MEIRANTGTEAGMVRMGVNVRSCGPPRRTVREWRQRSSLERRTCLMAKITLEAKPTKNGIEIPAFSFVEKKHSFL
jgi:hypothetical protein